MVLFGAGNEGLPEQRIGQSKNFTGDRFVHYTSKTEFWFCRANESKLNGFNLGLRDIRFTMDGKVRMTTGVGIAILALGLIHIHFCIAYLLCTNDEVQKFT